MKFIAASVFATICLSLSVQAALPVAVPVGEYSANVRPMSIRAANGNQNINQRKSAAEQFPGATPKNHLDIAQKQERNGNREMGQAITRQSGSAPQQMYAQNAAKAYGTAIDHAKAARSKGIEKTKHGLLQKPATKKVISQASGVLVRSEKAVKKCNAMLEDCNSNMPRHR